jgi:threonine synthase
VGLAVLEKLRASGTIKSDDKVVCISTANGLKFTEFKVKYHDGAIEGVNSSHRNEAVMLPADYGQVVDALNKRF